MSIYLAVIPAFAQPAPATQAVSDTTTNVADISDASMANWLAGLSDADPSVREEAATELMQMPASDLPRFRKLLQDQSPLAPAQEEAIRRIVCQVFLASQPYPTDGDFGFLGIQTGQVNLIAGADGKPRSPDSADGILVTKCVAGFHAASVLRTGDIILSVDGDSGPSAHNLLGFRQAIRDKGAGKPMKFRVLRQTKLLDVTVVLDRRPAFADLADSAAQIYDFELRRQTAFDEYWQQNFAPILNPPASSQPTANSAP